ncbi:hypothetical protein AK812_SmicGene4162 [Symbiodinium microadriaticum]|uniref:Uncharacterized protein n=1 Tax=Symbiodinium microadriaticum TaxID=2951 RepID=A0A1Q9EWW3_SYMMI|nr:hypothetical protein AK812_SmicGene4162 [Symbiodinium microadriaticum]
MIPSGRMATSDYMLVRLEAESRHLIFQRDAVRSTSLSLDGAVPDSLVSDALPLEQWTAGVSLAEPFIDG